MLTTQFDRQPRFSTRIRWPKCLREQIMPHLLIVIFSFSLITAQTRGSIQCFNCTTTTDVWCHDPFASQDLMSNTCREGQACFKAIAGSQVTRGCTLLTAGRETARLRTEGDDNCYTDIVSPTFEEITVCTCDGNLCNATAHLLPNAAVVMAVIAALVVPLVII